jgi:hypothetical protein
VNNVTSRDADSGRRRLRLNREDCDAIREMFAEECRREGLNVTATRRIDREHMRSKIMEGEAPAKGNIQHNAYERAREKAIAAELKQLHETRKGYEKAGKAGRWATQRNDRLQAELDGLKAQKAENAHRHRATAWLDELKKRAPRWHAAHAPAYLADLEKTLSARDAGDQVKPARTGFFARFIRSKQPDAGAEPKDPVDRAFQAGFLDAGRAKASFGALYAEDKRFAVWCLEKRPETFGRLRPDGTRPKIDRATLHQAFAGAAPAREASPGERAQVNQVVEAAAERIDGLRKRARQAYGRRAAGAGLDKLASDYSRLPDADPAIAQRLREQAQAAAKGKIAEASGAERTDRGPLASTTPERDAKFRGADRGADPSRAVERGPAADPGSRAADPTQDQTRADKLRAQFDRLARGHLRDRGPGGPERGE